MTNGKLPRICPVCWAMAALYGMGTIKWYGYNKDQSINFLSPCRKDDMSCLISIMSWGRARGGDTVVGVGRACLYCRDGGVDAGVAG